MTGCVCCNDQDRDLRMGVCFDCATAGEQRAANRTVAQHVAKAISNIIRGSFRNARYDLSWAWERLTRTGDYRPGGCFEREYGIRP